MNLLAFMPLPAFEHGAGQVENGTEVWTESDGVKFRGKIIGRSPNDNIVVETMYDNNKVGVDFHPPKQVSVLVSIQPK